MTWNECFVLRHTDNDDDDDDDDEPTMMMRDQLPQHPSSFFDGIRRSRKMQTSPALLILLPVLVSLNLTGGGGVGGGVGGGRRGSEEQPMLITSPATREYCQLEVFQATCNPQSEVIIVDSAIYGRMRLGRCVRFNYGYLGCSADVLTQLDRLCSGRRYCEVPVSVLHGNHPCPEDLTPYLEVNYRCLPVVANIDETCNAHAPVVLTSPTGYLPSAVTMKTGEGGRDCPWHIYVHPDQQINVTLLNFARVGPLDEWGRFTPVRSRICYQLAVIRERQFVRVVTKCEGSARVSHVYMSSHNVIDIEFTVTKSSDFYFLFHYEATPCFISSGKESTRRSNFLRCSNSNFSTRHQIECTQLNWNGAFQDNCTSAMPAKDVGDVSNVFPYSLLLIVSLGVALGVFIGGVLLVCGTRYAKRKRSQTWPTTFLFDHRSIQSTAARRTLVVASSEGVTPLPYPSLSTTGAPPSPWQTIGPRLPSGICHDHPHSQLTTVCSCGSAACRRHDRKWTTETGWT